MSATCILDSGRRWRLDRADSLLWLSTLPSDSIDALVTDPPYSSGGAFRGDRMGSTNDKYVSSVKDEDRHPDFFGDTRDQRSYLAWCSLWLAECWRVAKSGATALVFTDWRQLPTTTDAVQAGGWVWRGIVPWDKTESTRPRKGGFRGQCEYAVWATKGPIVERDDSPCLPGLFRQIVKPGEKHHIAGKPTSLMRDLVAICPEDGIVLDPFAGSASTGVGALLAGRRFVGCEMSEEYHHLASERLAASVQGLTLKDVQAGQGSLFTE